MLKKTWKKGWRVLKRLRNQPSFRAKFLFTRYFSRRKLNEKAALFQAYNCDGISGNPFYLLKEMYNCPDYADVDIYVVCWTSTKDKTETFLKAQGLDRVKTVIMHSKEYCILLASAKYLVNNVTFPNYFIKSPGQIYLNTWHGTPLKTLGKSLAQEMHQIGNVQRNFLMTDYLIAPNEFTLDILRNDYMITRFYKGEYLLSGYPRNSAFFNSESRADIREKTGTTDKKVVVFMPTWRGSHARPQDDSQLYYVMHALLELDKSLPEDYVVYAKLHSKTASAVNFRIFDRILSFPEEYETYEFLNIADCLITDYSSVMFDFANTGKKVILYTYDSDEYLSTRGMYFDFHTLPFVTAADCPALVKEVTDISVYPDYSEDIKKYIEYDCEQTAKAVFEYAFCKKESEFVRHSREVPSGKEQVLLFTGGLLRNGITTSLKGLLNNLDTEKRDYTLLFYKNAVEKNLDVLTELGDFDYISLYGQRNMNFIEGAANFLYFAMRINTPVVRKAISNNFKREVLRVFPTIHFDHVIHFTGYERYMLHLLGETDAKKTVFVHSVLSQEKKFRNNVHTPTLKYAYKTFDNIATVRDGIEADLKPFLPKEEKRIAVVHNINDIENIRIKAQQELTFDEQTESTAECAELTELLADTSKEIFVNLARYSVEKSLDRLIDAFTRYASEINPDSLLVISGSHGSEYEKILEKVRALNDNRIVIIKYLSNPFPILNKSSVFVLTSLYEGLPMTIMEALILGKPVICTDIQGPREFLQQGYGLLVDNNVDGIFRGMRDYKTTEFKPFDAEEFNRSAINEFESLFQ